MELKKIKIKVGIKVTGHMMNLMDKEKENGQMEIIMKVNSEKVKWKM